MGATARACAELGVPFPTKRFDGPDADIPALALDLNLKRRHLDASQRAMLIAALERQTHGGDRRSDRDAKLHIEPRAGLAKLASVSPRSVGYAARVRHKGIPELIAAAEAGKLPVDRAARLTKLSPERQRQVVERISQGVTPQQAIETYANARGTSAGLGTMQEMIRPEECSKAWRTGASSVPR